MNVPATLPEWSGSVRVLPGWPDKSVLVSSMKARGTGQMPPTASETNFAGVAAVEAFVRSLPPR